MKSYSLVGAILCVLIIVSACKKENDDPVAQTSGRIEFKTINPLIIYKTNPFGKAAMSNPPLTGSVTSTYTTSLKLAIGDVWVSQDLVKAGEPDDLDWVRLTSTTNKDLIQFEDYLFTPKEIPVGTYRSIKITFRNVFYRYAQLISDPTIAYELLETMGSWTSPCDENDTTWARTNYFGEDGNHFINNGGLFEIAAEGEKIGGFTIEPEGTAVVSWRMGAGVNTPCTTYLHDANQNLQWDCGIDSMTFDCPPEVKYMWDFVVEYK